MLVAPPGVGKSQAIGRAGQFWRRIKGLHVAPDSVTRASLIDSIAASTTKTLLPSGEFQLFHALNVASSEFGVLCPAHDLEFLNTLNDIYDARDTFEEARRARSEKLLTIDHPLLNLLAGTQPMYLSSLLPEQAWGMGFTARVLMIYSGTAIRVPIFNPLTKGDPAVFRALEADLQSMSQLYGALSWTDEAQAMLIAWYNQDLTPVPTHSRLQNYNTRRLLHVLKLCMVSSLSRTNELRIELIDVQRAQEWLLDAEARMPDIFREMAGTSDKAVIDDLHDFCWRLYARNKKPVHESLIMRFLSGKVPADKVMRIVDLAERSSIIVRDGPQLWKPGIKDNIPGVE